jgi:hypothetical protein
MLEYRTNTEVAAHLIQAYLDAASGKTPDPIILHIQSTKKGMKENERHLQQQYDRLPANYAQLAFVYGKLDEHLKDAAEYIKNGNVDPKVLYKKQKTIAGEIASVVQSHWGIKEVLDDPDHRRYKEYKDLYGRYDHDKMGDIDPVKAVNVMMMSGETKTAAR